MLNSVLLALDATQIVLIVLIGLLLIAYPILTMTRNKRENQKMQEQTNSLKRGDKVMTTSGVYGTIVELKKEGDATIVTLETGTAKNKGYVSVNALAIYSILNGDEKEPEKQVAAPEVKAEEKKEESKTPATKVENEEKKPRTRKKEEKEAKKGDK